MLATKPCGTEIAQERFPRHVVSTNIFLKFKDLVLGDQMLKFALYRKFCSQHYDLLWIGFEDFFGQCNHFLAYLVAAGKWSFFLLEPDRWKTET